MIMIKKISGRKDFKRIAIRAVTIQKPVAISTPNFDKISGAKYKPTMKPTVNKSEMNIGTKIKAFDGIELFASDCED